MDCINTEPQMNDSYEVEQWVTRNYDRLTLFASTIMDDHATLPYNGEDLAQSAIKSLLNGINQNTLDFNDELNLWNCLCKIVVVKVREKLRAARTLKRNSSPRSLVLPADSSRFSVFDPEPLPDYMNQVTEELEHLLSMFDSNDLQRRIVHYKLNQYTNEEIAGKLKIGVRTVYRQLNQIRYKCFLFLSTEYLVEQKFQGVTAQKLSEIMATPIEYVQRLLTVMLQLWQDETGLTGEIEYLKRFLIDETPYSGLLSQFSGQMLTIYEKRLPRLSKTWTERIHLQWQTTLNRCIQDYVDQ